MSTKWDRCTKPVKRYGKEGQQQKVLDHFWQKVNKKGPHECWLWTGSVLTNQRGDKRGTMMVNRRRITAHRLSYELFVGTIPEELSVCHTCDNGLCVNPSHLFLGTQQDNVTDSIIKGRFWPSHPRHPLTGKFI